jgi:hypothetical protein
MLRLLKITRISLLFLFWINPDLSQNRVISGQIINIETNLPIKDISVGIKGVSQVVVTDEKGKFQIEVPFELSEVSFTEFSGMTVQEIKISEPDYYKILLKDELAILDLSIEELMNLKVVSAGKKAEEIGEIPASVVVLTRKEIEAFGYSNLREILNNVPGYYAMSNLGTDIYGVRGFTKEKGSNFIIMINGTKITDEKILRYYQIPVEAIDKIEIVRGPMAVIYGNNAFFGVINIITNSETGGLVSTSYGTLNSKQISGRAAFDKSGLKVALNMSLYSSDGADFLLEKMMTEPERMDEPLFGGPDGSGLDLPDYAKQTKNFLSKSQNYFDISTTYKGFYFNTIYFEAKNGWYYYYPSLDEGSQFTNRSFNLLSGYRHNFSDKLTLNGQLRYLRFTSTYDYNEFFEGFFGLDLFDRNEFEAEANLFWNPHQKFNLTVGLQYENVMKYENFTNVPFADIINMTTNYIDKDDNGVVYSGFLQADFKPLSNLKLYGGVRVSQRQAYSASMINYQGYVPPPGAFVSASDDIGVGDIEIIPRFAAIYWLNKNNVFKLLYGKAGKRPDYETMGDDMLDIVRGEKPTGYSESEYITTYEINYISTFSQKLAINFSLFRNLLDNLIVEKSELVNNILRAWWDNAGTMETNGLEATFQIGDKSKFYSEISGVYQKTTDMSVVDTVASYSPEFLGYLKLSYKLNNQYTISLLGNYIDKMEPYYNYTPIFDSIGVPTGYYVGRTSKTVPAYVLIGLNVRLEPNFLKGGYLNLNCSNLLNQAIYYPTFSINNAWADRGTLGDKRRFYITLGYKF